MKDAHPIERRQKIIAVNRFYWPDHSATSQILTDLCRHAAASGFTVTVITSRMRYDDEKERLRSHEIDEGVEIRRVRTSRMGRGWGPGRVLDYFSFFATATWAVLREARAGDIVLVKTDPPLMSVPLSVVAKLRGAHLVNWLQDLLPEAAGALGMGWAKRWPGRVLQGLRNRSLNGAALNVTVCEPMAQELARQGVQGIRVIPNWPDGRIRPVRRETNPLRAPWGLEQSFVIGYSGNLGKAHCAQSVAHLVRESRKLPGVRWLFIGGGSGQEAVKQAAEEAGVEVNFQPYQLRASLSDSLSVPDIHLVTLDPACEGLIMPSKLYGVMAAGRPVIALGDPQGSVAQEVIKGKMGVVLDINAPDGWVETLRPMLSFEAADVLGIRAGRYFEERFTPERALGRWVETLDEVGGGPMTVPSVPVAWAK